MLMVYPVHPSDALDVNLPREKHLGELDAAGKTQIDQENHVKRKTKDELRMERAQNEKPPLSRILNLSDMEVCKTIPLFSASSPNTPPEGC